MLMWIWYQIFCCKRRIEKYLNCKVKHIPPHKFPWIWIGVRKYGSVISVTDEINQSIEYDVCVDIKFLKNVTGIASDEWIYLDNKTLEEKVFPLCGFLIDDPNKSRSS